MSKHKDEKKEKKSIPDEKLSELHETIQKSIEEEVQREKEESENMEKTEVEKLQLLIEQQKHKIADLSDQNVRLIAEFDNYRKRTTTEIENIKKNAAEKVAKEVIGVLDSFEFALRSADKNSEFVKGIEMIFAQLFQVLESQGVMKIECLHKKFDHRLHEALMSEESKYDADIIIEELQKGYIMNGKVIRHSKVKISSGKSK